jgi:hypothetical protein
LHWVILPTKKNAQQNAARCSTLLEHSHHFDYWNKPVNMCKCDCYVDCHDAGLCCYLVVHVENLSHPLQLFYFHLWPIYWLSLI